MLNLIRENVPQEELLAQLAEEAVELAHAALKLRRTYGNINPTPVSKDEALAALKEEIADVLLLLGVLKLADYAGDYLQPMTAKLERWARRLGALKEG